ncbi:uncharacterized protein TNCV_2076091 [Trichonephila clavipes]|nr:uncharacterized protein TNCV_2076091 [Trichonephila clavipes]
MPKGKKKSHLTPSQIATDLATITGANISVKIISKGLSGYGTPSLGPRHDNENQEFKLLSDRCESGGDQSQSTENPPDTEHRTIRISSLQMTPVDLSYVPILLNETFITALWDTGAEKSFISEEVYRRYFSYRPHQKT